MPEQAPLQPEKVLPLAAVAVKETEVLLAKLVEQVVPQLIPAGLETTVPLPVLETVRAKFVGADIVWALQLADVPPFDPAQVQDQGPEPVTELAEPVEQRLEVGAEETFVLLAEPQTPFTGVGVGVGV